MKTIKIIFTFFLATIFILNAETVFAEQNGDIIDWEKGVIRITSQGNGKNSEENRGVRKAQARRAAIMLGERELAERVKGVQVASKTTVRDLITKSDRVKIKVENVISGYKIVREEYSDDDSICEMDFEIPLFGVKNSLALAVIQKKSAEKIPFLEPTQIKTSSEQKNYSGLIVDCRNLNLNPTLLPAIVTKSGRKIYSSANFSYDEIVGNGIAGYASDTEKETRAGKKILMVKAVALIGNKTVAVISDTSAERILSENQLSKFLERGAVVFLK